MDKLYQVNESSLIKIADAIRDNYKFSDKLSLEEMPLYLKGQSNLFWVTHFNEQQEGAGYIYTIDPNTISNVNWAWNLWVAFKPVLNVPNAYEITEIYNYLTGATVTAKPTMPEGGFIYGLNLGNDYTSSGGVKYNSGHVSNAIRRASEWQVGD
jgi:hypothetical protein